MANTGLSTDLQSAIAASWERCERQHRLLRNAAQPIMRLRPSEIAPRLEQTVERSGGRQGIFRQLAGVAAKAGQCLVVTDAEGVLVRLETADGGGAAESWNGIALGSCWDERIAGTNGVSMAMSLGSAITVRGGDHFYSQLRAFACSGVPLLDAGNSVIGSVNLVAVDKGNPADYLFAQQLLGATANRVQRVLFQRRFHEAMLVSLADGGRDNLLRGDELVAVDGAGIVLGGTARAHRLAGLDDAAELVGRPFQALFGAEAQDVAEVPDRVLSLRSAQGAALSARAQPPGDHRKWHKSEAIPRPAARPLVRRRLAPSLRELAVGSHTMAALCERAANCYRHDMPFLLEGETGTGKSALVAALRQTEDDGLGRVVTVDCATLGEGPEDRNYINTVLSQTRVIGEFAAQGGGRATLIFDNIDELPGFAQAALRRMLDAFETERMPVAGADMLRPPRVVSISGKPLTEAVAQGRFRNDLYYLLAGTRLELPALRDRERPDALAETIATRLAGGRVEITPEAAAVMSNHGWPGNLREMRNVLEQALMAGDGCRISPVELRVTGIMAAPGPSERPAQPVVPVVTAMGYDERSLLLDALAGARWNVSRAARSLGMGRATIHRKMKKYDISRPG